MKKFILLTVLLLTGCTSNMNIKNVLSMKYNNTIILEKEYDEIIKILTKINFSCGKKKYDDFNLLTLTTNDNIYNINISTDHKIEYKENNQYCNAEEEIVENLNNYLKDIEFKYNNESFYNLEYITEYNENNKDYIIKLDKNNSYLVINSIYDLYNFKINEINNNEEVNLLYSKDIINKGKILIRKKDINNIKISFETEYNYIITIIPEINNDIITYKKTYKQKNS